MCKSCINIMPSKQTTPILCYILLWTILIPPTICGNGTNEFSEESITTEVISTTTSTTTTTIRSPPQYGYGTLVRCQCGSAEVMDHTGKCQSWADSITVPMEPSVMSIDQVPEQVNITELSIIVKEPQCQFKLIDLKEGHFHLRFRGDLLVTVGALRGLRVKDYCIQHRRQVGGKVKVTSRGCVSMPAIQRCCPIEKHMIDGECVPNTLTYVSFNPPLATGPVGYDLLAGEPFPWADRKENLNKLVCSPGYFSKKVELDGENTYLFALPDKVLLTWKPEDDKRQYTIPQDYCVDVPGDDDTYYAYSCQKDLDVLCKNKTCTHKCCAEGKAMEMTTKQCLPSNLTFTPPFPIPPSNLTTLYGFPSCQDITDITNFNLSQDGTLLQGDMTHPFTNFCMDNFIVDDSFEIGVLACIDTIPETTWRNVKQELFPVCIGLSCFFLALLLILHIWIPKLREKEGKYQLFHAASLFIAYLVNLFFLILVPKGYVMGDICVALAFIMQFAFLSAFFWLNTMCFDVWRLFRSLVSNMFSPVRSVATWKYMIYAVGGPLIITGITITVQFVGPNDGSVPGLVHPHIGEGRCWFKGDLELLVYFYGPIAVLFCTNFIFIGVTYHYLRMIRGDYRSDNEPNGYTINSAETTRKFDFFAAFWQRFYLLALVAGCWLTEILSWKIPPEELWAATDILNNLQGVFVFFVFLTHHNKRALLKEKLPKIFHFSDICINQAKTVHTNINDSTKKLSKKISSSSLISNLSSLSSFSTSTSDLNRNELGDISNLTNIRHLSLVRKVSKPLNTNIHHDQETPLQEINQTEMLNQKKQNVSMKNCKHSIGEVGDRKRPSIDVDGSLQSVSNGRKLSNGNILNISK